MFARNRHTFFADTWKKFLDPQIIFPDVGGKFADVGGIFLGNRGKIPRLSTDFFAVFSAWVAMRKGCLLTHA